MTPTPESPAEHPTLFVFSLAGFIDDEGEATGDEVFAGLIRMDYQMQHMFEHAPEQVAELQRAMREELGEGAEGMVAKFKLGFDRTVMPDLFRVYDNLEGFREPLREKDLLLSPEIDPAEFVPQHPMFLGQEVYLVLDEDAFWFEATTGDDLTLRTREIRYSDVTQMRATYLHELEHPSPSTLVQPYEIVDVPLD